MQHDTKAILKVLGGFLVALVTIGYLTARINRRDDDAWAKVRVDSEPTISLTDATLPCRNKAVIWNQEMGAGLAYAVTLNDVDTKASDARHCRVASYSVYITNRSGPDRRSLPAVQLVTAPPEQPFDRTWLVTARITGVSIAAIELNPWRDLAARGFILSCSQERCLPPEIIVAQ